jgi:serine/threonine protein kinase/CheY-like chemotaxis protein
MVAPKSGGGARRVLVIEPDLAASVVLAKSLAKAGLEVRTTFGADEALARLEQERFDAVVANADLPDGGGRALLERLRDAGAADRLPVVALLGRIDEKAAQATLQAGASDVIERGAAVETLLAHLERAIERGPRAAMTQRSTRASGAVAPPATGGPKVTIRRPAQEAAPPPAPPPPAKGRTGQETVELSPAEFLGLDEGAAPPAARSQRSRRADGDDAGAKSQHMTRPGAARSGVQTLEIDARAFVDKDAELRRAPRRRLLEPGEEIPVEGRRYRVVRELAAGAMGGAFLVRRAAAPGAPPLEEVDAVMKVSAGGEVADESLRVEQLVLRSIDHPNVVRALDAGLLPGREGARFLVLERLFPLPPQLFSRKRAPRALDPRTALHIFVNLLDGLHAIHAKARLILGDVKPDNVMLRVSGIDPADEARTYTARLALGQFEPVFIDFGSALSQEVLRERKVLSFTGSPTYMAPEAFTRGRHSARRDVFALALTFYEHLTGERPYGELGERPLEELLDAIRRGAPPVDLDRVRKLEFDEPFEAAALAGRDSAKARAELLRNLADVIGRGADLDPARRSSTYQLAEECRLRFQVRARHRATPGFRLESPLLAPIDAAWNRYHAWMPAAPVAPRPPAPQPPEPPPRAPEPARPAEPAAASVAPAPPRPGAPPEDLGPALEEAAARAARAEDEARRARDAAADEAAERARATLRAKEAEAQAKRADALAREREAAAKEGAARAKEADERARAAEARAKGADEKARAADERARAAEEKLRALEERALSAEAEARALGTALAEASEQRLRSEKRALQAKPLARKLEEALAGLEGGIAAARATAGAFADLVEAARADARADVLARIAPAVEALERAGADPAEVARALALLAALAGKR